MRGCLILMVCLALEPLTAHAADPLHFHFTAGRREVKKANKTLNRWLRTLAKREFPAKMRRLSTKQAISRAQLGVMDMRDAVAERPAQDSAVLMARQTALAIPDAPCSSLERCPSRIRTAHADEVAGLSAAVVAVVRPWLLLQHRRSAGLSLHTTSSEPGTLATMRLEGLVSVPIDIRASPAPMGGLDVWLSSVADLDDIYAFSREAALKPSRPR